MQRSPGDEQRRQRRRELLQALLAEEAAASPAAGPTEAELVQLLRELRREQRAEQRPSDATLASLLSSDQMKGFLWGAGAATLLMMILPTAKEQLRPLAVTTIKSALGLVDHFKEMMAGAGEGLQDIIAEAQFERMKETAGPDNGPDNGPDTGR